MTDAPTAGRIAGREHLLPIRVYFEDTDFSGVVFHASYIRFLERGRSDYLRLSGVHHTELREQGMAFAVVRLETDFRRPAHIDDALVVRTRFEEMRGPRLVIGQQVARDSQVLVEARVEAALIGLDGRPKRPTTAMLQAIQPLLF